MIKVLFISILVLVAKNSFAEDICRETFIGSNVVTVCFPNEKVCKYFSYHNMAPTLTYDCWSDVENDRNASNRLGCSNGQLGWPECANGYILD
ncbi:hypothetical protein [Halobacteriovorax sp. JY17]|uniref:hypothetical protein n=1 Tax=Halobacteriovorax sp. JY17 TaxID=2014617 RepID=UPI000C52D876|nr:hypothetical protein [Halobacteriovorax sp. JY17]PIK14007.1 MAG: hypothetical protein CES88_13570 [Halobacteriovorax sp. JY17]